MRQIDAIRIYQRKRCLVIDDMSEVRGSMKRMLKTFGMAEIDTAATSKQAKELCKLRHYDFVFCDYNLGDGQDGQQMLEELRYSGLLKNVSMFLMITAETSREMVIATLEYLPDDYLSKPITPRLLQARLSRIAIRHEDLLPIKTAIDDHDYAKAIELCKDKLENGGKYTGSYNRIQAELLFRMERFEEAQVIYEEALQDKTRIWAQLGLGKTFLAQKRFADAEIAFRAVLAKDNRFVEAHDLLADLYGETGDQEAMVKSVKDAAAVSPKSVLRQRRLATVAKVTNEQDVSMEGRRAALKYGEHSCYYSPQDYFDIVSELLEQADSDNVEERVRIAKEANMYINRAERKHADDPSIKIQVASARSRLASFQKKTEEAARHLEEAKSLADEGVEDAYAQLELAMAMSDAGDKEGAEKILRQIAAEHPNHEDLVNRVDAASEEPLSAKGRRIAVDLTRRGIELYEKKEYDAALEVFLKAIGMFPNHVGLRLNIIQSAISKTKADGPSPELMVICKDSLQAIENIDGRHKQYKRFQLLYGEFDRLYGEDLVS